MQNKRPTIQDIAREAGVSIATVSMILRQRPGAAFSEETRARVLAVAESLGYQRQNASAVFDRPTIAVFLPLITGSYYTFITQAVTQQAHQLGYDTCLLETHRNGERELRLMHSLGRMGVCGVIFTAPPINVEAAVALDRTVPTVIINNKRSDIPLDTVITDDVRVGELVADHLLQLGHRHVVFAEINRQWQGIPFSQRLVGVQGRFRLVPDARLTVISRSAPDTLCPGSFLETRALGFDIALEALQDKSITAFICISDYVAYGVMDALAADGHKIPKEYSVCACDNLFASSLAGVSLTTVDRHPIEVGNSAMELLAKQMQRQQTGCRQPEKVTRVEYLSTLVLRNSSCKPR